MNFFAILGNNKRNKESDKQSIPLDDIVEKFQIEEIASLNEIYLDVFLSKNQCTSYSFDKTPINQKAYIFLVYDKSGKIICVNFVINSVMKNVGDTSTRQNNSQEREIKLS